MKKLQTEEPKKEVVEEPKVLESNPLITQPNITPTSISEAPFKKENRMGVIITVVILIVAIVGLIMLYNYQKNRKNGSA